MITFIKPNLSELQTISKAICNDINTNDINSMIKLLLDSGVKHVILTMGEKGAIYGGKSDGEYVIKQVESEEIKDITDVCFYF